MDTQGDPLVVLDGAIWREWQTCFGDRVAIANGAPWDTRAMRGQDGAPQYVMLVGTRGS
jgi:hypothetical protein